MSPFEILEHTADVGVRATAGSVEGVFVEAALGLADIAGISCDESGDRMRIELAGNEPAGLLVDWLSEILWLHDSRDALIAGVEVDEVNEGGIAGWVTLVPRGGRAAEGTQVKAVTYHRLRVAPDERGWTAEFYVDV